MKMNFTVSCPVLYLRRRSSKIPMVSTSFFTPVENENKTEEHTSQVGEMGDVVASAATAAYAEEQLDKSVSYDEIFGFDGYGYEHEKQFCVREHHAECQQYAEYGTRSADGNDVVENEPCLGPADHRFGIGDGIVQGNVPRDFLYESGSDTGNHVENKETFSSPYRFEGTSEDENREHVEENMPEGIWVVHKHVGYHLCSVETVGLEIVQSQIFDEIYAEGFPENDGGQPQQQIDDDQVFCNRRYAVEEI